MLGSMNQRISIFANPVLESILPLKQSKLTKKVGGIFPRPKQLVLQLDFMQTHPFHLSYSIATASSSKFSFNLGFTQFIIHKSTSSRN
jgi:hypothetical protein